MSQRKQAPELVWSILTETPWAITDEGLRNMLAIADRAALSPEAVQAVMGDPVRDTQTVTMRNGVATLPIRGPLFRYANLMTRLSGATSYEVAARDFTAAVNDGGVRAILLAIDSPGGEANGVQELAQLIYQARGSKPIVAHVSGLGGSGGYWIASAADHIAAGETAILGSVGVKMTFVDAREAQQKTGVRTFDIVSAQSPRKVVDPNEPEGRAAIQQLVDRLGQVFVEAVARNRDTDVETVIKDYLGGWVAVGQDAVDAGLADRIATYEQVHAELEDVTRRTVVRLPLRPLNQTKAPTEVTMSGNATPAAAPAAAPASAAPATTAAPEPQRLTAEQVRAQYPELVTSMKKEERDRFAAIGALPAAGVEDVRTRCQNDPSCSVEAAAKQILEAQAEKTKAQGATHLQAMKKDETQTQAPTPQAAEASDPAAEQTRVTSILSLHRTLGGRSTLPASTDRRN